MLPTTLPSELLSGLLYHVPVPLLVVDVEGTLVCYNEHASGLLGRDGRAMGSVSIEEWSRLFLPSDDGRVPLALEDFPVVVALTRGVPAHQRVWTRGPDRQPRELAVTALPIEEQGRISGALIFVWPC